VFVVTVFGGWKKIIMDVINGGLCDKQARFFAWLDTSSITD
jgi:hypothetical protein